MFTIDDSSLEKKALTSDSSIASDHNKIFTLRNFFDVDYLDCQYKEQGL
jgi:hypothetical protein